MTRPGRGPRTALGIIYSACTLIANRFHLLSDHGGSRREAKSEREREIDRETETEGECRGEKTKTGRED